MSLSAMIDEMRGVEHTPTHYNTAHNPKWDPSVRPPFKGAHSSSAGSSPRIPHNGSSSPRWQSTRGSSGTAELSRQTLRTPTTVWRTDRWGGGGLLEDGVRGGGLSQACNDPN